MDNGSREVAMFLNSLAKASDMMQSAIHEIRQCPHVSSASYRLECGHYRIGFSIESEASMEGSLNVELLDRRGYEWDWALTWEEDDWNITSCFSELKSWGAEKLRKYDDGSGRRIMDLPQNLERVAVELAAEALAFVKNL